MVRVAPFFDSRCRMQVWNVLHVARWKYRTHKWCKKSSSGHHHTTLSGYIFVIKACIDNRKKLVKQQYLPHSSLRPPSWKIEISPYLGDGWTCRQKFGTLTQFDRLDHSVSKIGPSSCTFDWFMRMMSHVHFQKDSLYRMTILPT